MISFHMPYSICDMKYVIWNMKYRCSIDAYGGLGGELSERTNSAHSIPWIFVVGPLALAFVPFQKAGNESLASQRGQPHAAGLAVIDDHIRVLERDDLDDGARLRRVISDLVAVFRRDRLRAGQP